MNVSIALLKDEKTDPELIAMTLTGIQILFTRFTAMISAIPAVLDVISERIHHWLKKKKSLNPTRCLLLQFLRGVFSDKQFFVTCLSSWSNVGDPNDV